MEYIKVGNIVNTFGIRGELKVRSLSDFTEERFKKGNELYILFEKKYLPFIVKNVRIHKGFVLLLFEGYEDINLVEKYKYCDVFIGKDKIASLDEGSYYFFELKGCSVYNQDRCIGVVEDIESGYQSVLRIRDGEKEVLIPYVNAFIKKVNLQHKRIDVNVIEGML